MANNILIPDPDITTDQIKDTQQTIVARKKKKAKEMQQPIKKK